MNVGDARADGRSSEFASAWFVRSPLTQCRPAKPCGWPGVYQMLLRSAFSAVRPFLDSDGELVGELRQSLPSAGDA